MLIEVDGGDGVVVPAVCHPAHLCPVCLCLLPEQHLAVLEPVVYLSLPASNHQDVVVQADGPRPPQCHGQLGHLLPGGGHSDLQPLSGGQIT